MTALVWGVKASLLEYLVDVGDATTTCSGGAESLTDGRFRWPAEAVAGGYRGRGLVRLEAHGGMLDVRLESPALLVEGERVRLELARGGGTVEVGSGIVAGTRAALAITAAGARMLGDVYPPGTPLDDLTIEP